MVLPLGVDVGLIRIPWANLALISVTVIAFFVSSDGACFPERPELAACALDGAGIGIVAHVFAHADVVHLLGNMLFLWVFGNAVCARLDDLSYLLCYFALAAVVGISHVATSDRVAVGASGAINGVVGMFVVLHPKDYVTVGIGAATVRQFPAWAIVVFWLLADLAGAVISDSGIGHAAHVVGLVTGTLVAIGLLKAGRVMEAPGPTLLDLHWRR